MVGERKLCVICVEVVIYRKRLCDCTERGCVHDKE